MEDYYIPGNPVMIRGLTSGWSLHQSLKREKLFSRFGNRSLENSSSAYPIPFGEKRKEIELSDFLSAVRKIPDFGGNKGRFIYGRRASLSLRELYNEYPPLPPILSPKWGAYKNMTVKIGEPVFYVGGDFLDLTTCTCTCMSETLALTPMYDM